MDIKRQNKFIEKAKIKHKNYYDYSKVEYCNAKTKVCIICPIHGEFWQTPNSHLNGCGCPLCGLGRVKKKLASSQDEFIEKAKIKHKNYYDYSKVEYINNKTKVCIICPIHGEFWQTPDSHLRYEGCLQCSNRRKSLKKTKTTTEWVKKAIEIHKNYYDYSKVEYKGYYSKVCIICPIHGEFWQLAYNHLQGKGCPKCKMPKLEIDIKNLLDKEGIEYIWQYRPLFLINGKSHLSIDFYLPQYKIGIECQGKQHYTDNTFYSQNLNEIRKRDEKKFFLCLEQGIKIIYYSEVLPTQYIGEIYNNNIELLNAIYKNE